VSPASAGARAWFAIGWAFFGVLALVLIGVEAAFYAAPESVIRHYAGWAWLSISCLVLLLAFGSIFSPFLAKCEQAQGRFWFLFALLFPAVLTLIDFNGITYTTLNTESTQQMAAAVRQLHENTDLGIFNTAFLDYPERQYLPLALPSVIFGPSVFALRLGYALFYLIAYGSFLAGVCVYLRHLKFDRPYLLASFTGLSVALAPYPLLWARLFEQTIIPISIAMLFLGGLLFFLTKPTPFSSLWLLWTFGMMPYSYTPTLALIPISAIVLVRYVWPWQTKRSLPLLLVLGYGAATMLTGFSILWTRNYTTTRFALGDGGAAIPLNLLGWIFRYGAGYHAAIGLEEALVPAHLVLAALVILYISLSRRDWRFLVVALWSLAVIASALTMRGYCARSAAYDLHRAMILLPPLSLAVTLYMARYWRLFVPPAYDHVLRGIIMGILGLLILNASFYPLIKRNPRDAYPDQLSDSDEAAFLVANLPNGVAKVIYVIPGGIAVADSAQYFQPAAQVVQGAPPAGEHLAGSWVLTVAHPDAPPRQDPGYGGYPNPRPYFKIIPE
jgi:hypothetical protein